MRLPWQYKLYKSGIIEAKIILHMLRQSFLSVTMKKVCVIRTNKQERGHHGDISAMNLTNMREKD